MDHDLLAFVHRFVVELAQRDETQKQFAAGHHGRYRIVSVPDDLDGLLDFRVQLLNGGDCEIIIVINCFDLMNCDLLLVSSRTLSSVFIAAMAADRFLSPTIRSQK